MLTLMTNSPVLAFIVFFQLYRSLYATAYYGTVWSYRSIERTRQNIAGIRSALSA